MGTLQPNYEGEVTSERGRWLADIHSSSYTSRPLLKLWIPIGWIQNLDEQETVLVWNTSLGE